MDDMEQDEYVYREWLEFFYCNADFGPSHGDVMCHLMDEFELQSGERLPESVTEGYR